LGEDNAEGSFRIAFVGKPKLSTPAALFSPPFFARLFRGRWQNLQRSQIFEQKFAAKLAHAAKSPQPRWAWGWVRMYLHLPSNVIVLIDRGLYVAIIWWNVHWTMKGEWSSATALTCGTDILI